MDQRRTEIGSNEKIIDVLYSLADARAVATEIKEMRLKTSIDIAIMEAKAAAERFGVSVRNLSLTAH
ncbi:MAG: hypothetical protein P4L00_10680 [Candidatus Acidoferrales bacterium]|nr:hypothetical protein [Candidatus Acidoferrales bacterium]